MRRSEVAGTGQPGHSGTGRVTASAGAAGSGAGRLAYDLHQQLRPEVTVALDFNPLLALVARGPCPAPVMQLWEFPIAPRSISDHAVLQTLEAPEPVRDGFHLLLADVLRPPLAAESVDVVVTPWVVDILPEDFHVFAARVNSLLKPGGRWIYLRLPGLQPARGGSPLQPGGGSRHRHAQRLCRAGGLGRRDTLYVFSRQPARPAGTGREHRGDKEAPWPEPPRHRALPDWLVGGTQPVPLLPDFQLQTMTTRIYGFIMGLIDGRRSVTDMAKLLADQRLMTREEAEPAVRTFLTKMYEDSQRPKHFGP